MGVIFIAGCGFSAAFIRQFWKCFRQNAQYGSDRSIYISRLVQIGPDVCKMNQLKVRAPAYLSGHMYILQSCNLTICPGITENIFQIRLACLPHLGHLFHKFWHPLKDHKICSIIKGVPTFPLEWISTLDQVPLHGCTLSYASRLFKQTSFPRVCSIVPSFVRSLVPRRNRVPRRFRAIVDSLQVV